jgi:protein-L-isoaspartate(D-aspartate) O-methyltransferase
MPSCSPLTTEGLVDERHFDMMRDAMLVEIQANARALNEPIGKEALDERVIEAMARVPRHGFVPVELQPYAYLNRPLPIGFSKTISQPFIVAVMTDLLQLREEHRVLEIGTGLGYQAAILARLVRKVYSVELIEDLARDAMKRLKGGGYDNVEVKIGNGYYGWPEHAPFDAMLVTAAPELVPPPLIYQLKPGGKMVIPTGLRDRQQLVLVEKDPAGRVKTRDIMPVRMAHAPRSKQKLPAILPKGAS